MNSAPPRRRYASIETSDRVQIFLFLCTSGFFILPYCKETQVLAAAWVKFSPRFCLDSLLYDALEVFVPVALRRPSKYWWSLMCHSPYLFDRLCD